MSKGTEAPARPRRVLFFGGSGMLAGFRRSPAHSGSSIFVLCWNSTKFKPNVIDTSGKINAPGKELQPIYTDYRDHQPLEVSITRLCAMEVASRDIIGWAHKIKARALHTMDAVDKTSKMCRRPFDTPLCTQSRPTRAATRSSASKRYPTGIRRRSARASSECRPIPSCQCWETSSAHSFRECLGSDVAQRQGLGVFNTH